MPFNANNQVETQVKKEKNATEWNELSETAFPNLP